MADLVQHHVKYEEIHGVDEIAMLTRSEHVKLHIRLRKEGKCEIPVDELRKISDVARLRTSGRKKYSSEYERSLDGRARRVKQEAHTQGICFSESFGKHTVLTEQIRYNHETGSVSYSAWFQVNQGHKLPVCKIN